MTHWLGQIRYADFASGRRYTTADPRGGYRVFLSWGLGLGFMGAGFLWRALWQARNSRRSPRRHPWRLTVPFLGAVSLAPAGAASPWLTNGLAPALAFTGVCTAVVAGVCGVVALGLRRGNGGDR